MKSEFWKQIVVATIGDILTAEMGEKELLNDPAEVLKSRLDSLIAIADYLDKKSQE